MASFAWAGAIDFVSVKAEGHEAAAGVESRAESLDLRFCGDLWSWSAIGSVDTIKCYIYVTPEVATKYAGNKINSIVFNVYVTSAANINGSVFVSEDMNASPVVEQSLKLRKGSNDNVGKFAEDKAYTIKAAQGFYMGYKVIKPAYNTQTRVVDYPIGFDEGPCNQYCGYVQYTQGTKTGTLDVAESGSDKNLYIYANTSGPVTEAENIFATGAVTIGNFFTLPVCKGGDTEVSLPMFNCGTNAVKKVEYEYSVNGGEAVAMTADVDFAAQTSGLLALPVNLPAERGKVAVKLKSINDVAFEAESEKEFIAVEPGFDHERKLVVEEFTGTWCGWCPRGIVGFEKMEAKYPEKFVGIAVHIDDNMQPSTYNAFINKFANGAPSSIVNRDPLYAPDPSFADLDAAMQTFDATKAAVVPMITGFDFDDDSLSTTAKANVQATVGFGFSDKNADYKLAFVVLEDSVLGRQTNYYAGGSQGAMDGWEKKGQTVTWQYKHVARSIYSVWGINASLPAAVEAGEEYTFDYELSFKGVRKNKIKDAHVVMLVLDAATGTVLNACKAGQAEEWLGIGSVAADKPAAKVYGLDGAIAIEGEYTSVDVYTIAGQKVGTEGLAPGIYVVCVDGVATKVQVK